MSKKLILFLMVLLLGSTSFLRADELTVHDGTATNSYVPVYGFYADAYLKCEMVFPAAELADMENGTITGMTFYAGTASASWGSANFQVFVSEVSAATISDFAGPGTVVYEGPLSIADNVMNVVFATPYEYQGGNLLVGLYNTVTGSYVSCSWNGEAVDGSSVQGYSYSSLSSVSASQRNFLPKTTFTYTPGSGPTPPPTPGDGIVITPANLDLGQRPTNGWMEPFEVNIENRGVTAVVSVSLSNTSNPDGEGYLTMSDEIDDVVLENGESLAFIIEVNPDAPEGEYTEELTMFSSELERSITTLPVTAELYEATWGDIVEKAEPIYLDYQDGYAEFEENFSDMHANYNLPGINGMAGQDVVLSMNLAKDSYVAVAGANFIGVYNKVLDLHPTASLMPVKMTTADSLEVTLLAGDYYIIAAGDAVETVTGAVQQIPAPLEVVADAPEDGATDVNAPVTLTWHGGENATEYQVLFGTSPVNMDVVLDWTMIDDNYGTYLVEDVDANTQYFWQIKARNSNGTVVTERRGFTTTLIAPSEVTASDTEIFTDGSTLIKWKLNGQGSGFTGELTVADGTQTSSYIPVYGLWMDDYTRNEMIYPAEMLAEMEGGEITSLKYYISSPATDPWTGNVFNIYMAEVNETTLTSYYTSANATIVYTGALDGQGTTMEVTLTTPYTYNGGNLLVGYEETQCSTWKSCSFYGITATGASAAGYSSSSVSSVTFNQQNFLPKTTFVCGGRSVAQNRTFQGFNVYYGDVKANDELITEREYLLENLPYNMEGHDVTVTAVYSEGESNPSDPGVVVKVSGYGNVTGQVTELMSGSAIADATVSFNGTDEFGNTVTYEGTTNANGVYTIENMKAGNYNPVFAAKDLMQPAFYDGIVTIAYPETTTGIDFIMHEVYNPVLSVYAEEIDPSMSRVKWSMTDIMSGGNGGGNGGGNASEFEEGFENGMPDGWTIIDGNNDGWTWTMTSAIPSTWTYYAGMTLDWYRTGSNAICSGSYINGVGALTPDEFIVTPQVTLVNGSTFSFWAAATDESYPADHFGVFVSNNGTSDWTMVNEWTLTAKSATTAGGRESRNGKGARLGSWHNYSVDLSQFAGQKYIAIRHFNCSDQYIMVVDDITLSNGSKGTREVALYNLYRTPILTEEGFVEDPAELTPEDAELIATLAYPDSLYADFEWNDVEPGLYLYGVSAIYPAALNRSGNRSQVVIDFSTGDFSQFPNGVTTGPAYPWTVVNSDHGMVMKSSNGGVASSTSEISTTYNFPTDGTISFKAECKGEGTSTAWDKCIFELDGVEQFCYGANQPGYNEYVYEVEAGEHTMLWKYTKDSSVNPTGDYMMVGDIVFEYQGAEPGADDPTTPITWSNVLPKNMETTVTVNAFVAAGSVEGTVVLFENQYEEGFDYAAELDETGTVTFENFRKGIYLVTIDLEGFTSPYAETVQNIWDAKEYNVELEEIFKPVDAVAVSHTGFASWTEVVAPIDNRFPEQYFLTLDGMMLAQTTDNFMQLDEIADLAIGTTYTLGVAVIYSTGMSEYEYATFTYQGCDVDTQVQNLVAANNNYDLTLAWNGSSPVPPTPPTPPTPGQGQWYYYDNGNNEDAIGTGGGNFWWGIMLPAGSYQGNMVTKTAVYDYMAMTGTVSIYNDGSNAPAGSAVGMANVTLTGSNNFVETEFASPVVIDPTKNVWVVYYNGSGATYPAAVCANTGDANGRWVSLDGTTWEDLASYNLDNTFMIRAYVAEGAKGEVKEIKVPMGTGSAAGTLANAGVAKASKTVESAGTAIETEPARNMWDYMYSFNGTSAGQQAVATDGNYIYTASWQAAPTGGYTFYMYDLQGTFIEGFNIAGATAIRDLTTDGQYFYGTSGAASIFIMDFTTRTLVGTINCPNLTSRHISYDPVRQGFWSGNWSTLALYGFDGSLIQNGPAPESAYGSAYYKDADNVEHLYLFCQPNSDAKVYDYNLTTGTFSSSPVFDFASTPGYNAGIAGGCFVGDYNGKACFFGNVQQDPNLIGIYELGEAQGGGGGSSATIFTRNKFNILVDGVIVGATSNTTYDLTATDTEYHDYTVLWVDGDYNISCETTIRYRVSLEGVVEQEVVNSIYPNPTNGDLHVKATAMTHITIVNAMGQVVYSQDVNTDETVVDMAQFESGVYMLNIITENGSSVKRVTVTK